MKEHPILFSTPMVQAILAGNKTMTRRVIKPQPTFVNQVYNYALLMEDENKPSKEIKGPYGQPGDILWVRETWRNISVKPIECPVYDYREYYSDKYYGPPIKWKPSIHMPKAAARIWLEVVSVRVERLNEITAIDAKHEGIGDLFLEDCAYDDKYKNIPWNQEEGLAVHQFARLWDSINAKRGYGWDTNPWVWVVEFKVLEARP